MHVGQDPGAHYPHDVSPTFRQTHNQYHVVMFLLLVVKPPEIGWLIPSKISMCMLKSPLSHQIEYHSYVLLNHDSLTISTGRWFGTFFIFPYIGIFIIPADFHIFFRGVETTKQSMCIFKSRFTSMHWWLNPSRSHFWVKSPLHWDRPWDRANNEIFTI
jgi:hypothetical protein